MSARYAYLLIPLMLLQSYSSFFTADEAYKEGDIRLVEGSYNWEGRVEIYWSGIWGTISDSSWTTADANVVCRQLQHSGNGTL